MKKGIKILSVMLLVILIISISTLVFADEITQSMSGIGGRNSNSAIYTAGGKVLGIIQAIGISVAVIMIVVIAIRFMLASAEGKAEIKSQLLPYLIGAILLFATSAFLGIAFSIGDKINKLGMM